MIDPKTLRIGNLVRHNKSIYEVISIDSEWLQLDNDQLNTLAEQVEPIILTGDILLKCGFEKIHNLEHYDLGQFSLYFNHQGKFYPCIGEYDANEVMCLHQLQNLYYALTGTELSIDLSS